MRETHPTEAMLAAYAAGSATPGVSLAVAAHLTWCPGCRSEVEGFEALAGAFVAEAPAAEAPEFGALLLRLDEAPAAEPAAPAACGPLPAPVAAAVGMPFDEIPWRFRLPGVHEYEFLTEDGESASLLRVRPGAAIPQHTHRGEEITVVFDGALVDGARRYGPGDMALADPSVDHHPRAGEGAPCICLAVLTGGLRFTGRFGRALNLFT